MDNTASLEKYREFLEYWNAHVDPNDQLPVRVPSYNLVEAEIAGEVVDWVQQYLLQMKCPQVLLVPIVNEVLQETKNSYLKTPTQYGFEGKAYNPLKLSATVISHTNTICKRLLDNAELNDILSKSSADVLTHTPRHCVQAIKNTRRKMEDRHVCFSDFNGMFGIKDSEPTSFYGVFDGHGGQDAATYTAAHLCYNIAKSSKYPHHIEAAIRESFLETDAAFIDKSEKHALSSGTTALVCIYRAIEKRLLVGWVGDSQALLVCEGKVCQIVSPHIPSMESERTRIEKLGGVILNWSGAYRVNGQLAISRAIGDATHKPFITSEPDTSSISLEGKEDFLIIASDGLWESVSEDYIALFIYREIAENPGCADTIADKLIKKAKKGTTDNITVVVVFFKDPHLIAKSTWLSKMEAAYDKGSNNNAFENDPSHCKFNNMDSGLTITTDMSVSKESEDCQTLSPSAAIKLSFSNPSDDHILDKTSQDVIDSSQRFEDDFGPETDVDTLDEAAKSPADCHTPLATISDFNLSNGVKSFSLENKIIQHLSEQNRDLLAENNPFRSDHFEHEQQQFENQLLDHTITEKSTISPEPVVDNKIIDALESMGITNGENEKHVLDDEKHENELIESASKTPEMLDFSEKVDYTHEKTTFISDLETERVEELIHHHSTDILGHIDLDTSHDEQAPTPIEPDTGCVEGSVGEDSEEEEDEWNYYKGDKKPDEQAVEAVIIGEISKAVESNEPVVSTNELFEKDTNIEAHTTLLDKTVESITGEEELFREGEKTDKIKDAIDEISDTRADSAFDQELSDFQEESSNQVEKEPTDIEGETCDPPVDVASPIPETLELAQAFEESTLEQKLISSEQATSLPQQEADLLETKTSILAEDTIAPVQERSTVDLLDTNEFTQPTSEVSSEPELETSVDEEPERPNSLSFEMASKLNPEAKEFVPVSSPTRSDPTSPVSNVPSALQNSYLMISDDTVIAQSPKKGNSTMDNIDVPAEADFQHEMNNRPHELEKSSEYTNGNADPTVRSHSPASEPSYQELNLKEAMQCDEKLEFEYNDEKQTATEDSSSEVSNEKMSLNMLGKEQNAMNMSFYEGRDEGLLSNNSDELNKVHTLPDEEELIDNTDNDDVSQTQRHMVDDIVKEEKGISRPADRFDQEMGELETVSTPQSVKEDPLHEVREALLQEEQPASIFAVASQVVNDVTALVDEMQIEAPIINDTCEDKLELIKQQMTDDPVNETVELENLIIEENQDTLIHLDSQIEHEPEDTVEIDTNLQHSELDYPITDEQEAIVSPIDELTSPIMETLQQEVVDEKEFIMDESVLNVPSPTRAFAEPEISSVPNSVPSEVLEEPLANFDSTTTNGTLAVEQILENIEVVPALETSCSVTSETVLASDVQKLSTETKSIVTEIATATAVGAAIAGTAAVKSVVSNKSVTSKSVAAKATTGTTKSAKPAVANTDKKPLNASKPLAKPAKPTTVTKSATTTVKKTTPSSVSATSITKPTSVSKSSATTATTRTSLSSASNKPSVEKKPLPIKKPSTSINGDVKAPVAKKPLTLITKTSVKSNTTSSSSSSARPSSTTARSTTAKPLTALTRSVPSAAAKTSSTTTRTSNTAPVTKPRTVTSATNKTTTVTSSASATTVASKTSQVSSTTKRISNVHSAPAKAPATTRTNTTAKTSTVTSRTSTVSKPSSTPAGLRKTSTTPNKKPVSSTGSKMGVKASPGGTIVPVKVSVPGHNETVAVDSKDLFDLEKQLKNDSNQLITKNGIDSQMIVIDSAAD